MLCLTEATLGVEEIKKELLGSISGQDIEDYILFLQKY